MHRLIDIVTMDGNIYCHDMTCTLVCFNHAKTYQNRFNYKANKKDDRYTKLRTCGNDCALALIHNLNLCINILLTKAPLNTKIETYSYLLFS